MEAVFKTVTQKNFQNSTKWTYCKVHCIPEETGPEQ